MGGGSEVRNYPWLQSEFDANLRYRRSYYFSEGTKLPRKINNRSINRATFYNREATYFDGSCVWLLYDGKDHKLNYSYLCLNLALGSLRGPTEHWNLTVSI